MKRWGSVSCWEPPDETSAIADSLNALRTATPEVLACVERLQAATARLQSPE